MRDLVASGSTSSDEISSFLRKIYAYTSAEEKSLDRSGVDL